MRDFIAVRYPTLFPSWIFRVVTNIVDSYIIKALSKFQQATFNLIDDT